MSKTQWISHRGYHQHFPENSKSAFEAAVDMGFTTLETDLRCTSDGEIVISHDSSLLRETGKNKLVENITRLPPEGNG